MTVLTNAEAWLRRLYPRLEQSLDWWPEVIAAALFLAGMIAFYGFANLYATAAAFLAGFCLLVYAALRQRF